MVTWDRVTRDEVMRAITEYDQLGPAEFFSAHGFGQGSGVFRECPISG